jgi:hypothetical protein
MFHIFNWMGMFLVYQNLRTVIINWITFIGVWGVTAVEVDFPRRDDRKRKRLKTYQGRHCQKGK